MKDRYAFTLTGPVPLVWRDVPDDDHDTWSRLAASMLLDVAPVLRDPRYPARDIALALAAIKSEFADRIARAQADSTNPREREVGQVAARCAKAGGR